MSAIYAIYICNHENNVPSALSKQTVDHVPKYMSCHEAIVVITGRAHCFHDCIYIYMQCIEPIQFCFFIYVL